MTEYIILLHLHNIVRLKSLNTLKTVYKIIEKENFVCSFTINIRYLIKIKNMPFWVVKKKYIYLTKHFVHF